MAFTTKAWQNSAVGGTRVNATALIDLETRLSNYTDAAALASNLGIINMLKPGNGVVANGTTDDGPAMQAVINASPIGATIFWPAYRTDNTAAVYGTAQAIRLLPGRSYLAGGWAKAVGSGGATIKQVNGAQITAPGGITGLLVPGGWVTNATVCDGPISVTNFTLDVNQANNTLSTACGLLLCNFWSTVRDNYVKNANFDGIRMTDTTANGTNVITNSASENSIYANKIVSSNGCGIRQISANGNSNLDGFCRDNLIDTVGDSSIKFARGAGWVVERNHTYGRTVQDAIVLDNCFATVVSNNYIEQFGDGGGAGAYSNGISVNVLTGRGVHVIDNFITCVEPDSTVSAYQYINLNAAFGATAQAELTGNIILGPTVQTTKGVGISLGNRGGGGRLRLSRSNNIVTQVNTESNIDASAETWQEDKTGRMRVAVNAATPPALFKDVGIGTGAPAMTGQPTDVSGWIGFGTGTALPGNSSAAGVTFTRDYLTVPTITITPLNAASAALSYYVLPQFWGFGIGVVSLAPSQAGNTYQFSYQVSG